MRIEELQTPCYVIDKRQLEENLKILREVADEAGCKILLAQKAYSCYDTYPLIAKYLDGTTASGLFEARLGYEKMGKENHIFSPAYKEKEFDEIVQICDHILFNSIAQVNKFKDRLRGRSAGLRINPECSTQEGHAIYDPCAPGSRLGVTIKNFDESVLDVIDGLHFHTLCEQNSDDLVKTLLTGEEKFGRYLHRVKWLNFGGGHHITRKDYDRKTLIEQIQRVKKKYGVEVYVEPGEAIALNAGYLVTEVLEKVNNGITTLILDASAACHMPDVLELPYRPPLRDGFLPEEKPFCYRLSSVTCLAGDVIGDYSFEKEVHIGDKLYFEDMAIYSMVKNNTFNGMPLPSIALMDEEGECEVIKEFGYMDFAQRLGGKYGNT